jgi:hypothetical protein
MIEKFRRRTILYKKTGEFFKVKYLFMYRRKKNESDLNPLHDNNSEEVNKLQDGNEEMINKYASIFDNIICNNCVIIPMVSEYASKNTFDSISKLVYRLCLNKKGRIDGSSLITRARYIGYIKDYYKENPSNDILVMEKDITTIRGRKVIVLTDVINNNLSGYISYRDIIEMYHPKSIELVGLSRYVES